MKEIIKDISIYASYALGAYTLMLITGYALQDFCSRRISNKRELEMEVKKEAEIQGVKNPIIIDFAERNSPRYKKMRGPRASISAYNRDTRKLVPFKDAETSEGIFPINILHVREGSECNTGMVKHEIYHLKHHLPGPRNKILNGLKYFFYEEPSAILYALRHMRN
jgi:hypothetical protein